MNSCCEDVLGNYYIILWGKLQKISKKDSGKNLRIFYDKILTVIPLNITRGSCIVLPGENSGEIPLCILSKITGRTPGRICEELLEKFYGGMSEGASESIPE